MENGKYIKISSYSIASIATAGRVYPPGAAGLFRSIICIRSRKTKILEGFSGTIYFFEEGGAEEKIEGLQKTIDIMMEAMKESETYKKGNYEARNHLTGKWELIKL